MLQKLAILLFASAAFQSAAPYRIAADLSTGEQETVRALPRDGHVLIATHRREGSGSPSYLSMVTPDGRAVWRREFQGKIFRMIAAGDRVFLTIATENGTELDIVTAKDGVPMLHVPIATEEEILAVAADGNAIATYRDSSESGPSNQVQVRVLTSGRVWGLVVEGAVTRVALADGQSVFVGKLDGAVDAYRDHAKLWTASFEAASAVTKLQTSIEGLTVLAEGRSGRVAVLDGKTGGRLLTYDPNQPETSFAVLGVSDDIDVDRRQRQTHGAVPLSNSEIAHALKLSLNDDGRVQLFDVSHDKISVAREFDPHTSQRPRNDDADRLWSALRAAGYQDPEANAVGFANGPRAIMSSDHRLAVVVFDEHIVILQRRSERSAR